MSALLTAHHQLFPSARPGMEGWEMAKELMENFDIMSLGEKLAQDVVIEIVNHTHFPTEETNIYAVGKAIGYSTELFSGLSDEPHMCEIAWLENMSYYQN